MLKLTERVVVGVLLVFAAGHLATAQQDPASSPPAARTFAFVNVNLIRMDRERVEPAQTVVVTGARIALHLLFQ